MIERDCASSAFATDISHAEAGQPRCLLTLPQPAKRLSILIRRAAERLGLRRSAAL